MGTQRSQIEDLLFKSVVALTLFVLALYSIKTVLSDCTIFSKVNCQSEQSEIIAIEKEIHRIKQQISSVKDSQSSLECKEIDTASSSDNQSTKIDTSLWAQVTLRFSMGVGTSIGITKCEMFKPTKLLKYLGMYVLHLVRKLRANFGI